MERKQLIDLEQSITNMSQKIKERNKTTLQSTVQIKESLGNAYASLDIHSTSTLLFRCYIMHSDESVRVG